MSKGCDAGALAPIVFQTAVFPTLNLNMPLLWGFLVIPVLCIKSTGTSSQSFTITSRVILKYYFNVITLPLLFRT